jgi:hypothetical protein
MFSNSIRTIAAVGLIAAGVGIAGGAQANGNQTFTTCGGHEKDAHVSQAVPAHQVVSRGHGDRFARVAEKQVVNPRVQPRFQVARDLDQAPQLVTLPTRNRGGR